MHPSQLSLLDDPGPARLDLPGAEIVYTPQWLEPAEAWTLFSALHEEIEWRQDTIRMWGKVSAVPRLHQWFADEGMPYTWSGIRMEPAPWHPVLERLRNQLEAHTGTRFSTALANLYRDGQDSVGWHADDEPELGPEPTIASISLGATRDFQLRHKRRDLPTTTLALAHGSLLLMEGATQRNWKHQLPRRRGVDSPRINLTFRTVAP